VKSDSTQLSGLAYTPVPVGRLIAFERRGGAARTELESFFSRAGKSGNVVLAEASGVDNDESSEEGAALLRLHMKRERHRALVAAKLAETLRENGKLTCEACGVDLSLRYGDAGTRAYEVHHAIPLGTRQVPSVTRLEELAIVCPNCHSVIHRSYPMLTVVALAGRLRTSAPS
jgi:5-methylcytosine-specific restriction enzyme A